MSARPSPSRAGAAAPDTPPAPSGRLLLRMPSPLHAELARAAEREGTSLNQFIARTLAQAVGWQGADLPDTSPRSGRRRDLPTIVLLANAAAVALAAFTGIAVLLVVLIR